MLISKQIKKLRTDRSGFAIELALIVLVVAFSLGTLIVSISIMQTNRKRVYRQDFENRIVLEQIGQEFCAVYARGSEAYEEFKESIESAGVYQVEISEDSLILRKSGGETVLLIVTISEGKIIEWKITSEYE